MSEWDEIQGFDDWRGKLDELLSEAETVARDEALEPRLALNERLKQFILRSGPNTPDVMALDKLAADARKALMQDTVGRRLEALAASTGELLRLTKQVQVASTANETAAASLRLEKSHQVVSSLTESVRALGELRAVLKDGADDALVQNLERVMGSIQRLRIAVEHSRSGSGRTPPGGGGPETGPAAAPTAQRKGRAQP